MAGNPVAGANFGQGFLNNGKFGAAQKKNIKKAGFNGVNDFLTQAGYDPNSRISQSGQQNNLKSAFNRGFQPQGGVPSFNGVQTGGGQQAPAGLDPIQNQNGGTSQTVTNGGGSNVIGGLTQQGADLSNFGANILNNGNPASNPLLNNGSNFGVGAQQDFGKVDALAGAARAQGQNILNTLSQQQGAADQDIQNFFNGQPLDDLRSRIAQQNASLQSNGVLNSRSGNERGAELERGLIRDQAAARLGSNNQFRAATTNELDRQRSTDTNLAGLFSGQGVSQGGLSNQAFGAGGNLINDTNQTGANIFNQGFQNQLGAVKFGNDAAIQQFILKNQLNQQQFSNQDAAKSQRQEKALRELLLASQTGGQGGFDISKILGAAAGGALSLLP
jgi:hypothetical protein